MKEPFSKKYVRDKRSPIPKNESTSKVMSANKAKNTLPEMILRRSLRKHGLLGYRLHQKNIPGKPDVVFIKSKVAIFINGCYWHRCPNCNLPLPKSNTDFWKNKFDRNVRRDAEKIKLLMQQGWSVIVIWECQLKDQNKLPQIISETGDMISMIRNYPVLITY